MARPPRLSPEQREAHQVITIALDAANRHRKDDRKHIKCVQYAAGIIDQLRRGMNPSDMTTGRARRD